MLCGKMKTRDPLVFHFLFFHRQWVRAITLFPSLCASLSFFKIHLRSVHYIHVWSFASNWNNSKTNERPFKFPHVLRPLCPREWRRFLSVLINKSQRKSFLVALRKENRKKCETRDVWYAGDDIKGNNKKQKLKTDVKWVRPFYRRLFLQYWSCGQRDSIEW